MKRFDALKAELSPLRQRLLDHPLYARVNSRATLRRFMSAHVFAVWDFMSLAKRLQRDLTCIELPWVPPAAPQAARLINEVILGEETDLGPDGAPTSHLELYLKAMDEVRAPTRYFRAFLRRVRSGREPRAALRELDAPPFIGAFVTATLDCAQHATTEEVASAFVFGREDLIPDMFERLLPLWDNPRSQLPHFVYYLKRHLEVDRKEHGPMARKLLETLAGSNRTKWRRAAAAATRALESRRALWDGIVKAL